MDFLPRLSGRHGGRPKQRRIFAPRAERRNAVANTGPIDHAGRDRSVFDELDRLTGTGIYAGCPPAQPEPEEPIEAEQPEKAKGAGA